MYLLVLRQDSGVVRGGELECLIDVAFQYCTSDSCISVSVLLSVRIIKIERELTLPMVGILVVPYADAVNPRVGVQG